MSASTTATKKMLSAYFQEGPTTMFFTGFFQSPPENFYESEAVEIDVERSDEDVAIVIQDLSTGYRFSSDEIYTTKEFIPPIYSEAFAINSYDLIKRMPGQNPFESPDFQANATARAMKGFRKREALIRRAIELQAAQVLQTGTVALIDSGGATLYAIDYKPKSSHFPNASTAWDDGGATIAADIISLCNVVRNDGLSNPTTSIWGEVAWETALANTLFRTRFETRRLDQGTISPMQPRGQGAQYRGTIDLGNFKLDVWTYGGRYKHPQTGTKTQYMDTKKMIVMAPDARLDATFGAIPSIVPPDQRVLPFLPSRASAGDRNLDLHFNAWVTPDGRQLMGSVGTRPLLIPTSIDRYGCINSLIT